jgi:hypothetical protein
MVVAQLTLGEFVLSRAPRLPGRFFVSQKMGNQK